MRYTAVFVLILTFTSCSKPEGEGGRATISGTAYYSNYDHNNKLVNTEIAAGEKIYITYGETSQFDDDIDSYLDGTYNFRFLRKGNYTVGGFEDCATCPNDKTMSVLDITLDKNNSSADNSDIYLRRNVTPEDGTGVVTGMVWKKDYVGNTPSSQPAYPSQKQKIYIVYDSDSTHFERVDTDNNGYYRFQELIIGNYTVYAYSGCPTCTDTMKIVSQSGAITTNGEKVTFDDITVVNQF